MLGHSDFVILRFLLKECDDILDSDLYSEEEKEQVEKHHSTILKSLSSKTPLSQDEYWDILECLTDLEMGRGALKDILKPYL